MSKPLLSGTFYCAVRHCRGETKEFLDSATISCCLEQAQMNIAEEDRLRGGPNHTFPLIRIAQVTMTEVAE